MSKKKTTKEFIDEVNELVGDEYIVLGEYTSNRTGILMIHTKCNKGITPTPYSFLKGGRCKYCYGNVKKDTEIFKGEVYRLVGDEYSVIGEYEDNRTNVTIKHNLCNFEYLVKPYHFTISGTRCPKCYGRIKKTNEEFIDEIYNIVEDRYKALDDYIDYNTSIKFIHKENKCNHIFNVSPSHFIYDGQRCPKCEGKLRRDTKYYKNEIIEITDNNYECLGEYINYTTHILHFHKKCGNKWLTTPQNFLKGHRCPKCNESKGERAIFEWLTNNNINFIQQYTFDDCRYKRKLPFDFAILSNENKLLFLIEYDGRQHFESESFYGGEVKLRETIKRDNIKDEYCKNKGINLIRIPYWDFDKINEILNDLDDLY